MNKAVYQIASFMIVRNPVEWRWSHTRHHSDTIIVGRDPEIVFMKPIELFKVFLNFFGILDAISGWTKMLQFSLGQLSAEIKDYVPEMEHQRLIRIARIWLAIYVAIGVFAYQLGSILPFMLVGLPRLYGAWHHVLTGLMQHGGLADDVIDHRLNSRTVYMNPISQFIYWNMNYHVEHHMFPLVPYHALPKLHQLIKDDLPAPNPSIWHAYREMWPAIKRQLRYEEYFLLRELPPTAKPYKADFHQLELRSNVQS
jgi:fatty acid desaturase